MIEIDSIPLNTHWLALRNRLQEQFGKKPDLQAVLYLIGLNELGLPKKEFTKEEKQDLIHIGICKVLSYSGYYDFKGLDPDGWPHFEPIIPVPKLSLREQEELLRAHVVQHFLELNYLN